MTMVKRLKRAARELLRGEPVAPPVRPESFEEQIYAAVVQPGAVCFDVGANQGDVAIFLARLTGEPGTVVAFEPVWPMYAQLCAAIQSARPGCATILPVPAGLADADRDASIQVPGPYFGVGSMADADRWSEAMRGGAVSAYPARFFALDTFLATSRLPVPNFVKIDVEGAEWLVLRGAVGMFDAGHRPLLLIEVFAPWEKAFNYGPWQPLSWLQNRGYRFLFACPEGLVAHEPTADTPFPPAYVNGYNVLAYHPDHHGEQVEAIAPLRAGSTPRVLPMAAAPRPNVIEPL